ncbi:MAG: peptidoglycan DD-metalloendopeptidase family protein [Acidiferrobacterales bacterium]|nr:peptidoglycan DD-metalloendopeptidase family protein [Acidiferrobacterales bacterium]
MFTGHYNKLGLFLLTGAALVASGCGSVKNDGSTPIINMNIQVTQSAADTTYTGRTSIVQAGDNLYSISFAAGYDYRDVADWNGMADPEQTIYPGQEIKLYPPEGKEFSGYQQAVEDPPPQPVSTTESTSSKHASPPKTVPTVTSGPSEWIWPAQGDIISSFSKSTRQNGIQIAGDSGAPVKASADGKVVYSGTGLIGYGRIIIVKHSPQFLSVYAHNSRVIVKEGETVAQGQKIAEMGSTDADRVKLHFEIRKNGTPVDPTHYLPKG